MIIIQSTWIIQKYQNLIPKLVITKMMTVSSKMKTFVNNHLTMLISYYNSVLRGIFSIISCWNTSAPGEIRSVLCKAIQ